ncbi:hypothetical protein [Polyangium sp. 6x1]|uniref:hypothetical protein n=1 Tax=Polyangium sp. 6x1 TaxID=3042689 RepID=UPI0024829C3F|nr:hypothetical protein [Polyangium sp. 6x1]MDI1446933.1 hypothetical protein [Polyangium sp. 6x1]
MKHFVTSLIALALVGAGSLIGCSDDSNNTTGGGGNGGGGGGGNGGGGVIPLDDLGTKTAELYCGLVYSCCTMAEQAEAFGSLDPKPTNEAECAQAFKGFYDNMVLPDLKAAVEAGRLEYDGELLASCTVKVANDCTAIAGDPFEKDAECGKIFVGKVEGGGDCADDDECAGADSVCIGNDGMAFGKCQPRGGAGAACDFDGDCTTGYCDFPSNMCAELKALGDACIGFDCKDSYCEGMTSVCTAKKADGAACTSFDECVSGECDTMTNTCVAPPAPICDGM